MSNIQDVILNGPKIDDFEGPEDEVENPCAAEEVSEEAVPAQRTNRSTRRRTAHIPHARRKPNFQAPVAPSEDVNVDEETDDAVAQPQAEPVSEETLTSDQGHDGSFGDSFESPMKFGDVDG